jgi:hypothetical protein
MPSLENRVPDEDGKSLTRRARRGQVVIALARAVEPGAMALRLRRCAVEMSELAQDAGAPAADRISAAKALVSVQAQLLDLIGWTKRPPASPGGKRPQVLVDVSPSGPTPADLDNV